jgi:uncharacterized protein (DUF58 family)
MHHSYRNVRQLDYQLGRVEPVFCQQPVLLPLNLTNHSPRPIRQLDIAYLPSISRSGWWPLKQFSRYLPVYKAPQLAAEQTSLHLIPIPTNKRGWQDLGRMRLSSVYPIGLLLSWFFIDIRQRVLIYPRPMGNKPLPPPSAMEDSGALQHQQGLDDFAGFHRYRVGDARQHIAWKALARDGILRTKQFSSPSGQKMLFNWDDVADLPDTEAKLSQLCQWILTADTAGMQYGLILPKQSIAIDSGDQHRHFCLRSLALYGQ